MKAIQFFVFILLFSIFSCGAPEKEKQSNQAKSNNIELASEQPYHIKLTKQGKEDLKASLFADSVIYIPLETNSKTFLRRAEVQVRMNDSVIAICDMQKVLLFRHDGSFIRQIGKRGKGPGEYGSIGNFDLEGDTLYISSFRRISKYTLDGKSQGDMRVLHPPEYFRISPEGDVAFYNAYIGEVYFYDLAFNLKDTLVVEKNVSNNRSNFQTFHPADLFFQTSKGKLLFTTYISDTIWNLSGANKKAAYVLDLKEKLLPMDKQVECFNGDFKRFWKMAEKYDKVNLKEMSDHLFILQKDWSSGKVHTIYLHNFKDKTTGAYNGDYIYDDMLGGIKLKARPSLSTKDAFITAITGAELVESLKELNEKEVITGEEHKLWKDKMSKVKYDDNSILVIFKPKKNP